MIASFPMYLRPENRAAHDAYWSVLRPALADRGIAAPASLDHSAPVHATWRRPDLVLGQICNYPYRTALADRVTLVGAGDYGLPGAEPGTYYSVFVARADDPRRALAEFAGATFAYNAADSQSGWAAPRLAFDAAGVAPGPCVRTGGHRASARAVAEGRADLAALDAVTWAGIARWDRFAARLTVLERTGTTPGLSFVTAGEADPAPYLDAMTQALAALPRTARETLGLRAVVPLPRSRYMALPIPAPPPA